MNSKELQSYTEAGEISKKVKTFARELIKPGMLLLEIAQKIEAEIIKLGAEPAFPVNLSIDDIAAHYHPTLQDTSTAKGLLKVDIGIHIQGCIADSAFTLDLTKTKEHTDIIHATEEALQNAIEETKKNTSLSEIGKTIQETIEKKGFSPIINLSGHGLETYEVHANLTIPNYDNGNQTILSEGAYAIEPFATYGEGKVYEGPPSTIYQLTNPKNTRGTTAREILDYIVEKKKTLPFSLREMQEKFGPMARLALNELEQNNIVHHYPQLIEKSHKPVTQAEHTIIKTKDGVIVTT
jgi:methionyl aminopeptidase